MVAEIGVESILLAGARANRGARRTSGLSLFDQIIRDLLCTRRHALSTAGELVTGFGPPGSGMR